MRNIDDERKKDREKEKNGENSTPLTSLPFILAEAK